MSKFLVISDTHITPDNVEESKELWQKLGEYCVKTKPDYIIHLGDVGDFNSQAWLKANRGAYTLEEEIQAVKDCVVAFQRSIKSFNNLQRIKKKKLYRPYRIITLGNHDVRNDITNVEDLFNSLGWHVMGYLKPLHIDDITFVHCAHKGLSDTACTTSQELVENWHCNIVTGHGHHKDFFESYSMATGKTITGLRCPCFMKKASDWAIQTRRKWSKGFTEIESEPFSFVWRNLECLYEN